MRKTYVYFAKVRTDDRQTFYKIGISYDPIKRMRQIEKDMNIILTKVLVSKPYRWRKLAYWNEQKLHNKYAQYRTDKVVYVKDDYPSGEYYDLPTHIVDKLRL
jgi:hypothetical protein